MAVTVPLVTTGALALGAIAVLLFVGVALYALTGDDEWSNAPASAHGANSTEEVCPRCHHWTPSDANACPECGKSL
jgi:uncharacterized paraquat-inducible protein A